eukprot:757542-Rhodomonas_salina.1
MNNGIQAACKLFQFIMMMKSQDKYTISLARDCLFEKLVQDRLNDDTIELILNLQDKEVSKFDQDEEVSKFDHSKCELVAIKWMSYEWHHKIPQEYTWLNFQHRMQTFAARGYKSPNDYVEPLNLQRYEEARGGNWQLWFMSDLKLEDLRKKLEEKRKKKQEEERSEQECS